MRCTPAPPTRLHAPAPPLPCLLPPHTHSYYHPANVTIAIAGAVDPDDVAALAQRYFGAWKPLDEGSAVNVGPYSPSDLEAEPSARPGAAAASAGQCTNAKSNTSIGGDGSGVSSSSIPSSGGGGTPGSIQAAAAGTPGSRLDYATASRAGPLVLAGYYRPSLLAPSTRGPALEAACDVLAGGRAARLTRLVNEGRLLAGGATVDYPGDTHAGMVLLTARPRPGAGLAARQLEKAASAFNLYFSLDS